jgi:hypothetical protein
MTIALRHMTEQAADQCAFTHAVTAEQSDRFTAPYLQVNAVQNVAGTVPGMDRVRVQQQIDRRH